MMHKAAVAFFLSRMEESLTAPVPLLITVTDSGAHLMLFTRDSGLIVSIHAQTVLVRMEVPAQ